MAGVFVSYRRIDSSGSAGRLFDRLTNRFGREAVFMDVEGGIPRGADFSAAIARAVESADALVVVIGPRWLTCTDAAGRRRLDNADDWVRTEIEKGLERGIPVLPVLVDGASVPTADDLPDSLRPFAGRQCSEITNSRWNYDVGELLAQLEPVVVRPPAVDAVETPPSVPRSRSTIWVAAGALALVAGAAFVYQRGSAASPIEISFDVWQDLGRGRPVLNVVNLSHEYVAAVIYGSEKLDVRDINVDTVNLSDGTGSAVPATMFHLKQGYDENNDGRDDLKLDYRIANLKSSGNKLFTSSTFHLTGRLKDEKGARPIRGEHGVAVVQ